MIKRADLIKLLRAKAEEKESGPVYPCTGHVSLDTCVTVAVGRFGSPEKTAAVILWYNVASGSTGIVMQKYPVELYEMLHALLTL